MSWLAAAAVTIAVLVARGPRGRSTRAVARRVGAGRWRGDGGVPAAGRGLRAVRDRHSRRRVREPDLALLATEVASRLRAGSDPRGAWEAALGHPVGPAGPTAGDLCRSPDTRAQAAAVVAACRLAADLGAPLAPLLDGVAGQLAAQAEADGDRRAALAGPRATAQVLTWLPVLGVLLGAAVGADPFAVLLDGSIGSAALVTGVGLVLTGRVWTGRLARRAGAAGRSP